MLRDCREKVVKASSESEGLLGLAQLNTQFLHPYTVLCDLYWCTGREKADDRHGVDIRDTLHRERHNKILVETLGIFVRAIAADWAKCSTVTRQKLPT